MSNPLDITKLAQSLEGWVAVVVDDEPDSLDVAAILLEMNGLVVHSAKDGEAGWYLITHHQPDFVLCDLSMPVLNGWELLARMKQDPSTTTIPVIALTAHAMPGDRNRVLAAGFHNYISKPLVPETFMYDVLRLLIDCPTIVQKATNGHKE